MLGAKISENGSSGSIKESINMRAEEDEIEDEVGEMPSGSHEEISEDIKESLPESSLPNMRRAIGSEEEIRNKSKETVKSGKSPVKKLAGGPFEKNSFKNYTDGKFTQMLL